MDNQQITQTELAIIRQLDDFDLTMLLSEINDHGWQEGRKLLQMIWKARNRHQSERPTQ